MSFLGARDFALEVPRGNVAGVAGVNKFGRSTDVDTTARDIWDVVGTAIWVAPTTARTHDIASTSASDTSGGAGARTIRIYGLTGWSSKEVSEDITMNGVTNVPTANSYVIIHRMKVLTKGATNVNVGAISATAQTDGTVTAQINIGQGQTQMAVYGIPDTQTAYVSRYYCSVIRTSTARSVDVNLFANPEPDAELTEFVVKHTVGIESAGASMTVQEFNPYYPLAGPAIIKIQATASANNSDVSAGFDLYLVDN